MLPINSVGSRYTKEKQILMQGGMNVTIINMGALEFDMGKVDERKYIWGSFNGKEQK